MSDSWPLFCDPSMRSNVTLVMPCAGGLNPNAGIGGMNEWG